MADEMAAQEVKKETEEATDISDYMDTTEDRVAEAENSTSEYPSGNEMTGGAVKEEPNANRDSGQELEDEESDDDEDDSDEDVESSEPLATTRSRRANAGNRMSTLLLEEEDEFYSTSYGGFKEEEDDDDFDEEEEADEVEVEEDYDVDSDFDIDETDEIAPEHQAVDEERRTRKSAYREPKRKIHQTTSSVGVNRSSTPVQPKAPPRPGGSSSITQSPNKHRPERSFRDSTKKKTAETIKNIESVKKRKKFRNVEPHRRLTQEEMLEEAKLTEAENLKSLEIYRRLEAENLKKIKLIKKSIPIPYITYYSSVFTNPETKERYSRNLCTYVGCEPGSENGILNVT